MNLDMSAEMKDQKHNFASVLRGTLKRGCNTCPERKMLCSVLL